MAVIEINTSFGKYYTNSIGTSNYLNTEQMKVNALYIYNYLKNEGWTLNAISGLLGNTEVESTHNPGIWQNNDVGNTNLGYGLVQWTPATNYLDWIGSEYNLMDNNLRRIKYEQDNNLQYIPTILYPLSFNEFIISNDTPENLASAWLKNYERAGAEVESVRRENARKWFNYLKNYEPVIKTNRKKFPWVLYAKKLRLRY